MTIIIPNSKLISEEVYNYSYSGQRIRQHIRVSVAYGSNVKSVKELLQRAALNRDKVLHEPPPLSVFEEFGDSSLNFVLRFWCKEIWKTDQISSDIRTEIDVLFREAKVEIPFSQRDIHIKS